MRKIFVIGFCLFSISAHSGGHSGDVNYFYPIPTIHVGALYYLDSMLEDINSACSMQREKLSGYPIQSWVRALLKYRASDFSTNSVENSLINKAPELVWVGSTELIRDVKDEGNISISPDYDAELIRLVQLALQNELIVTVNKPLLDRLPDHDVAAFLLHESLEALSTRDHLDKFGTEKIRRFVKLSSDRARKSLWTRSQLSYPDEDKKRPLVPLPIMQMACSDLDLKPLDIAWEQFGCNGSDCSSQQISIPTSPALPSSPPALPPASILPLPTVPSQTNQSGSTPNSGVQGPNNITIINNIINARNVGPKKKETVCSLKMISGHPFSGSTESEVFAACDAVYVSGDCRSRKIYCR